MGTIRVCLVKPSPIVHNLDMGQLQSDAPSDGRQDLRLVEAMRRVDFILEQFKAHREVSRSHAGFNESVAALQHAIKPNRRVIRTRKPLHPALMLAIDLAARGSETGSERALTPKEISRGKQRVTRRVRAVREQPKDMALHWAVQALMVHWERTTGRRVTASRARKAVYEANLASPGAQAIYLILKKAQPNLTEMAVVNIIRSPETRAAIRGKTFFDFCPTYGWRIDRTTGLPVPPAGQRLEHFHFLSPIKCLLNDAE